MGIFKCFLCLGKGWENHIEGQKLKADGDSFRLKLDTQEVFDDWARKVFIIQRLWQNDVKQFIAAVFAYVAFFSL